MSTSFAESGSNSRNRRGHGSSDNNETAPKVSKSISMKNASTSLKR